MTLLPTKRSRPESKNDGFKTFTFNDTSTFFFFPNGRLQRQL